MTLAREAPAFMAPGGVLLVELGFDQWARVESELRAIAADVSVLRDFAGHSRVLELPVPPA
jgi:methylase of polypeptide subunit release factors